MAETSIGTMVISGSSPCSTGAGRAEAGASSPLDVGRRRPRLEPARVARNARNQPTRPPSGGTWAGRLISPATPISAFIPPRNSPLPLLDVSRLRAGNGVSKKRSPPGGPGREERDTNAEAPPSERGLRAEEPSPEGLHARRAPR